MSASFVPFYRDSPTQRRRGATVVHRHELFCVPAVGLGMVHRGSLLNLRESIVSGIYGTPSFCQARGLRKQK